MYEGFGVEEGWRGGGRGEKGWVVGEGEGVFFWGVVRGVERAYEHRTECGISTGGRRECRR